MCTLSLSDMGELRDDWLREPLKAVAASPAATESGVSAIPAYLLPTSRGRNDHVKPDHVKPVNFATGIALAAASP